VCFIVDNFSRMIVGWRVAPHMHITMGARRGGDGRWPRGARLDGLRYHADAGSQFKRIGVQVCPSIAAIVLVMVGASRAVIENRAPARWQAAMM